VLDFDFGLHFFGGPDVVKKSSNGRKQDIAGISLPSRAGELADMGHPFLGAVCDVFDTTWEAAPFIQHEENEIFEPIGAGRVQAEAEHSQFSVRCSVNANFIAAQVRGRCFAAFRWALES
jgi:hypothetical protein